MESVQKDLAWDIGNEENADTDKISADADGLEMVHSLDPQIDVMHLHLNENKDKLILHAEENGKYVVTIMDVATMNTLQKIEVMDLDKAYYGYQIYEEDDFFVNMVHKQKEEWKIEAAVLLKMRMESTKLLLSVKCKILYLSGRNIKIRLEKKHEHESSKIKVFYIVSSMDCKGKRRNCHFT